MMIPIRFSDTSKSSAVTTFDNAPEANQEVALEGVLTIEYGDNRSGDEALNGLIADTPNDASGPPLGSELGSERAERRELSLLEDKLYELFAAHVNGITSIEYVRCTAKLCESTYTATPEGHRSVGELFPLFLTEMGAPSSSIRRVEISPGAHKYVLRVSFP